MAVAAIKDVREVLGAYPELADVAVLPHAQESLGQVLVAYVVPDGPGFDLEALYKYVRAKLPGSAVPAAIMIVDAIPVDVAGEPEPQALPAPDLRGLLPYRSPANPQQEALCTMFAEVLGRPRCGVDDDFFSMGGESIDAMLIASRVGPAYGLQVSMNEVFDAPTVAELDELLTRQSTGG